jgi:hypothetical protein
MRINRNFKTVEIGSNNESSFLSLKYDNRGDPFREGVNVCLTLRDYSDSVDVFLESGDVIRLRDCLNDILK